MLAWLNNHIEIVVAILSAIIAVFGALVSRNETRKQQSLQMENLRHSIDSESLAWRNPLQIEEQQIEMEAEQKHNSYIPKVICDGHL